MLISNSSNPFVNTRDILIGSWNRATSSYYPQVTLDSWHSDGIGGSNNLKAWYDAGHIARGTELLPLMESAGTDFLRGFT